MGLAGGFRAPGPRGGRAGGARGAGGGVAQAPPWPRACPRRPLVLISVTRGLSRKETAPQRGGVVSRPSSCYRRLSVCLPISPPSA